MATWTGLDHMDDLLHAAAAWRQRCLLGNASVFSDKNLWTHENIKQLKTLFVDNPIPGEGLFVEKLCKQIGDAKPEISQLAAEAVWLLFLFVSKRSYRTNTKRARIAEVWRLSGEPLPQPPWLTDESLRGLARPGTAFLTGISTEYGFLLSVMEAWKSLALPEQSNLLSDEPWKLCEWITNFEGGDRRAFRHMFLYFCYPTHFERSSSWRHKREIYAVFADRLADRNDPYKSSDSLCGLDHSIFEIRKALQEEYATEELDFYAPPLRALWLETPEKPAAESGTEADSQAARAGDSGTDPPFTLEEAVTDLFLDLATVERMLTVWRSKKNVILQGPPGVGKTFVARRLAFALMSTAAPERLGFVQFHQSYSYEDFIQGYRPSDSGFQLRNGKFFDFCRQAAADPNHTYVFIIDEINRGNLSKIFGELMMLIEADKRGSRWSMPLAYGEADEPFFVPENVYLLGLMNTADRSLAVVDYALRRRFGFIDLKPQFDSEKFHAHLRGNGISDGLIHRIQQRLGDLNQEIGGDQANLGSGFCIGHSFFCSERDELPEEDWYRLIIETEVLPLLAEYWFDSPDRVETWRGRLLPGG